MEKYVAGGEGMWNKGLERIIKEIGDLRNDTKGELGRVRKELEKIKERKDGGRKKIKRRGKENGETE